MGMFEAGEWQTEVVEPTVQQLANDGDDKIGHLGEVRQPIRPGKCSDVPGGISLPFHRPSTPECAAQASAASRIPVPDADGIGLRSPRHRRMDQLG